jgi:hypothetical protein
VCCSDRARNEAAVAGRISSLNDCVRRPGHRVVSRLPHADVVPAAAAAAAAVRGLQLIIVSEEEDSVDSFIGRRRQR